MKKGIVLAFAVCLLCFLSGCGNPDSLQLDLSRGYGEHTKLIHLNASTAKKRDRITAVADIFADAQPLEKDFSMFAYYPDYSISVRGKALGYTVDESGVLRGISVEDGAGASFSAVVDINGEYVDFYLPELDGEASRVIYRSAISSADFARLINQR